MNLSVVFVAIVLIVLLFGLGGITASIWLVARILLAVAIVLVVTGFLGGSFRRYSR